MGEKNANEDLTLVSDKGGTLTVTSPASTIVTENSKGVHMGQVAFNIDGAVDGGCSQVATFAGIIQPSGQKNKSDSLKFMREKDNVDIQIPGTTGSGSCTINANVKIQAAGQSKAESE